ncbi:MAG: ABC transporter substrate-binding protein [Candidatus Rokubacteria bacterium]|nr:ABC transporter substrate-binding protein [Candidatus Rokubacteria bacterium]
MGAYRESRTVPSHRRIVSLLLTAAALILGVAQGVAGQPTPVGEVVYAWHVTIAPAWFDPSTAPPQITPFGMLYALHDAPVRPLPGQKVGNSLAESWTESADGRVYDFKLRRGLKFHNGDPVTAEDVKFSFERYKGSGAKLLQERVRQVEIVDPLTVRFHLKEPWPDFMTFYGTTATASGIVVPKKYLTQVGDDGFKKHPIGAGPYRFVSHKPGVEVVLEAYTGYWRKVPHVKRLVMKSVPETATRVAMLKNGEADIAAALDGEYAESVRRDPRLMLAPSKHASMYWIEFADQWDPKSPWHDKRMRLAVNYALDRKAISEAACLGYCPPAGVIVPRVMDFALQAAPHPYDPQKAKQLLAEAGYPQGLDAGEFVPIPPFFAVAEAAVNYLNAVGIRVRMRTVERAAFYAAWREKKLRGLFLVAAGNSGNAASRVEAFMYSKGSYAYGGYPDIDDLFQQQARERDPGKREALLHRIQQLTIDRVMFAPIMDYRTLRGVGPRLAEPALDSIHLFPYPAYEDIRLKGQ